MKRLLVVLWSTSWGTIFLFAASALLVAGGISAALRPGLEALDSTTVTGWLAGAGGKSPADSWWLWGVIGAIGLVIANGIGCLVVSLARRRPALTRAAFWLMHTGALLIPMAYLAGSLLGGVRVKNLQVVEGTTIAIPGAAGGERLGISGLDAAFTDRGQPVDILFTATVTDAAGKVLASGPVRFNHPLMAGPMAVYAESFDYRPNALVVRVNGQERELGPRGEIVLPDGRRLVVFSIVEDYVARDGKAFKINGLGRRPMAEFGLIDAAGRMTRGWVLPGDPAISTFRADGVVIDGLAVRARRTAVAAVTVDRLLPLAEVGGILFAIGLALNVVLFYRRYGRIVRPLEATRPRAVSDRSVGSV